MAHPSLLSFSGEAAASGLRLADFYLAKAGPLPIMLDGPEPPLFK
jgi:hypothetical protein